MPFSTRPGWDMHASGVDVTGMGEGVNVCVFVAVTVAVTDVWIGGVNGVTGAQATRVARSVKSIVVCFTHRVASLIA